MQSIKEIPGDGNGIILKKQENGKYRFQVGCNGVWTINMEGPLDQITQLLTNLMEYVDDILPDECGDARTWH